MAPVERSWLRAWACVVAWAGAAAAAGLCSDGAAFHSLVAGLNASGHWSAALDLQKDARLQQPRADALRLDVRPAASLCGDVRTVAMTVELRGSSPVIHIASTPPPDASSGARAAAPPAELGYARAPPSPGFYKVQARRVNWREAQAACEAEGAHLLVVETPQEAQAVAFLLRQHAPPHALSRTLHAGFFATDAVYFSVYGEPLSDLQYQRWAAGEPRHVDICGAVDHAGQLHDAFCSWNVRRSFVCEYGGPPAGAARGARRAVRHPHPTATPTSAAHAPAPAPTDSAPFTRVAGAGSFQVRGTRGRFSQGGPAQVAQSI
ncbi:Putative CTL7 [Gryllus bimaculatus]|nr:Putative CTL7 [Gryllus bimaculatus]